MDMGTDIYVIEKVIANIFATYNCVQLAMHRYVLVRGCKPLSSARSLILKEHRG